jgi:hypothetical protein
MRALCSCPMSRSVPAAMIGALICLGVSGPAHANVITDWDEKAVVVVTPMMASWGAGYPSMAQRTMAMVHTAMFDAVNSIEQRYRPAAACGADDLGGGCCRDGGCSGSGDN